MEKRNERYIPGVYAQRLLMAVLPVMCLLLTVLILYIVSVESGEFFRHRVMSAMIFDAIGRGLVLMLGGAIVLDYLEKKYGMEDKGQ
ncbi:MAG: hypothetical protein IJV98_05140 [Clostridia bacterium]|nr:hypothetical protein [Clostridia bacterium]